MDFSDHDALNWLTYAPAGYALYAEDTFAWTPWWFQSCNGLDHATVRPVGDSHFHLTYEDPDIQPCPGSFSDWGILQEDGTCEQFDPREKPRSVMPHDSSGVVEVYVWDGFEKQPFGLTRIRVIGRNPIRLCYKPLQEDDGEWESAGPGGSTTPGVWFCWDQLGTGNWDLSAFTEFITDVKISASPGSGNFHIDDIVLKLYE